MTNCERELIDLIRKYDDPDDAIIIATKIITSYLAQLGSSEEQVPACQVGLA